VLDMLSLARRSGLPASEPAWALERHLVEHLESVWQEPDYGIWEVRGQRRHFTYSKIMAWVAFDRAVKTIEQTGVTGPVDRWRAARDRVHAEVCARGYDTELGSFVMDYGSKRLDAALLVIPQLGFLPASDPRFAGTVAAVERTLLRDGFVERYMTEPEVDALPPGEGKFLAVSFWLADAYALLGRREEALRLFERLLSIRNDVGLLAEEYEPMLGRQLGNFPQALSHIALVNTARNLSESHGPARDRTRG
jgi:GH15 family glucan-1,4-alpha-glucosidase